jgi:uncharacterized integral membrane protein
MRRLLLYIAISMSLFSKCILFVVGTVLGAASVVFFLQNMTLMTVSFMWWSVTSSVALVLAGSILMGMLVMSLLLLPNFIREGYFSSFKRQHKEMEQVAATPEHATQ